MRKGTFILAVSLLALAVAGPASAAMTWRPEQTIDVVRGVPLPDVAVSDDGRATLVFSGARFFGGGPELSVWVRRPGQPEPFISGAVYPPGGATDARVAMSPAGVTAIAAVEAGRLFVTMFPLAPGRPRGRSYIGKTVEIPTPGFADAPQIEIDALGRATVAWASPPRLDVIEKPSRQVHAVTVGPDAVVGPVQAIGDPGDCNPALDVNLRGDVVVAVNCSERADLVYYRPAGGAFGAGEQPFGANGRIQVALDGDGTVHAVRTVNVPHHVGKTPFFRYELAYAARPAGGSFSPPEALSQPGADSPGPVDLEVQETGRVIVGWVEGDRFVYAVRPSGGSFGQARVAGPTASIATRDDTAEAHDVVVSPHGPVLLTWRNSDRIEAALLSDDGRLTDRFSSVAGPLLEQRPHAISSFAINDSGQVAGTWEQRCSSDGAFVVMAVQRDSGGIPREAPCQDRRAPRAIVVGKRALLARRAVRVRLACDEVCRLTTSARVLVPGRRKPIATAKTAREQRLAARRGKWVTLRLSRAEGRRIASARRAGRRVTVRLGVSVRDRYENGRIWRLRVPLRR